MSNTIHQPRGGRAVAQRIGLAASAAAIAVLAIGGGAALWEDTEEVEQEVSAGSVDIDLSGVGGPNGFGLPISDVAAGDRTTRFVTIENDSTLDLGQLTIDIDWDGSSDLGAELGIVATACSLDDIDDADDCTGAVGSDVIGTSAGSGDHTFAPVGSIDEVTFPGSLLSDFNDGDDLALRVIVEVDEDADDDAQGEAGTLEYTFTAVQRDPAS